MKDPGAILTTTAGIVLLAILIGHALVYPMPWDAIRVTGFVITSLGLVFLSIARFQLGDSFSIAPEAHKLITRGLYSRIRNPIYFFGIVAIAGAGLYLHLYPLDAVLLILVPLQIVRARAEAKVLEERFGDEYRAYRARTWF
jgi:protein-S-isoprenylcysteine O-methyltransferase Ste14